MRIGGAISITLLLMLLSVAPSAYSGDAASPPRFPFEVAPSPALKSSPVSSVALGSVTIYLGKTTLGEALDKIKVGEIGHEGDAGESVYWLCYSLAGPEGPERIWLLSHGEMGGPEHVIYGIAARVSSASPLAGCPELPRALRPARLDDKSWLGTPVSAVLKKHGKPTKQQQLWIQYQSRRKLPSTPRSGTYRQEEFYEHGSLSIRSRYGKVVELWATKSVFDD